MYEILIVPDGESFHAYCPGIKGLNTCGETRVEALINAGYAIEAYLKSMEKHKEEE